MKFKIMLEKQELETIKVENLVSVLKHFNNDTTEAYFKRRGENHIEIVISKKDNLKNLCGDCGIKHFDNREEYLNWLRRKNGRRDEEAI